LTYESLASSTGSQKDITPFVRNSGHLVIIFLVNRNISLCIN
jgi:hypothetical protein